MEKRVGGLARGREEEETQVFGRLFTVLLAVAFAEVGRLEKGQVERRRRQMVSCVRADLQPLRSLDFCL